MKNSTTSILDHVARFRVNIPNHLENGEIYLLDNPSKSHKNAFLCIFLHIPINHDVEASE